MDTNPHDRALRELEEARAAEEEKPMDAIPPRAATKIAEMRDAAIARDAPPPLPEPRPRRQRMIEPGAPLFAATTKPAPTPRKARSVATPEPRPVPPPPPPVPPQPQPVPPLNIQPLKWLAQSVTPTPFPELMANMHAALAVHLSQRIATLDTQTLLVAVTIAEMLRDGNAKT